MKNIAPITLLVLISLCSRAQQNAYVETFTAIQADSLKRALLATNNDTLKMKIARELGVHYQERYRDSSFFYHEQQLALARKLDQKLWQADALDQAGWALSQLKIYPRSLQYFSEAIKLLEDPDVENNIWNIELFSPESNSHKARMTVLGFIKNDFSQLFDATGETNKEMSNLFEGISIGKSINNHSLLGLINANLAKSYLIIGKPDSAIICGKTALLYMDSADYTTYRWYTLMSIGNSYLVKEDYKLAKEYFENSIHANQQYSVGKLSDSYLSIARLYQQLKQPDSSIYFAKLAVNYSKEIRNYELLSEIYSLLYDVFNIKANKDSAFTYIQLYKTLSDSLNKAEKVKIYDYLNLGFTEQVKLQELEKQYIIRGNKIRTYTLLAGIIICLLIAFLLLRNIRNRKKANTLLQQQKQKVESALSELTSTQAQLIQSEKMASLGELTAGIAHEIQNPLNFVNNFSEVNKELADELKAELAVGNLQLAAEITNDIKDNSDKINHHGKRADAIVKGMLQHSQSGKGQKELTDINALAEEYLRLSYHGLRAKDNTFNAIIKTDFDNSIGKINVVPQDIGRVLLNLYNNAFYAVKEKAMSYELRAASFAPAVIVSTKKMGDRIEIQVADNGPGIPQNIVVKIFQPFFTTKPTGQGTGLGLSLSYDIVKAHGGELKVETKEGEETTFIIQLTSNTQ